MNEYFPEPKFSSANIKIELDFSNYAKKKEKKKQI